MDYKPKCEFCKDRGCDGCMIDLEELRARLESRLEVPVYVDTIKLDLNNPALHVRDLRIEGIFDGELERLLQILLEEY